MNATKIVLLIAIVAAIICVVHAGIYASARELEPLELHRSRYSRLGRLENLRRMENMGYVAPSLEIL